MRGKFGERQSQGCLSRPRVRAMSTAQTLSWAANCNFIDISAGHGANSKHLELVTSSVRVRFWGMSARTCRDRETAVLPVATKSVVEAMIVPKVVVTSTRRQQQLRNKGMEGADASVEAGSAVGEAGKHVPGGRKRRARSKKDDEEPVIPELEANNNREDEASPFLELMVVASNDKRAFGAARRKQAEVQTAPLVGSTQEQESTQLQTAAVSLGKRHVQRRGTKLQPEDAEEVEELNCKGMDVKKANVPNSNTELEVAAFHVDEYYLSRSAIRHANPNSNVIEYVTPAGESDGEEAREDDRSRFPRASGEQDCGGKLVEFSSQSRDGAAAVGFQEYILSLDREDTVLAVQGKSSATQNGSLSATHQPHNCNRRTRASVQQYGLRRGRSISPTRRASAVDRRSRCQDEKDRPGRRYPKAYYDKKEKGPISSSHRISHVVQDDDTSVDRRTIWRRRSISQPGSHLVKSDSASAGGSISQRDSVIARETVTIVVIAGPTAVGKSALGIALAKKLGGEIISADSVQVYRGLDVGSAKTAVQERDGIPHHLLDIAFPDAASSYNGKALFARHAWQAVRAVVGRRKTPIVVGGSRMYTCWFIDEAARRGRDCRLLCYAVWKPYDMVYERIDERCEEMVVQGLLQEASWLLDMGVRPSSSSASRAIGYRQAMRFLEESRALDGATSRSRFLAFLTLVQEASRDLARKQLAFFAGDARFQSLNGLRSTEEIVRVVEADVLGDREQRRSTRHELRQLEKAVKAPWRGQGGEYAHFHHTRLRVFSQLEKCDEVVEWVKRTQRKISTFTEEAVPEIVFEEFSTY